MSTASQTYHVVSIEGSLGLAGGDVDLTIPEVKITARDAMRNDYEFTVTGEQSKAYFIGKRIRVNHEV